MKNQTVFILTGLILSVFIAACGNDNNRPSTMMPPDDEPMSTLAGGQLAQDFADMTAATTNALTGVVPGSPLALPTGEFGGDFFAPAPPSIGADVPVTYFGPAPSSVNPNLVGPLQLLTAGTLDLEATPHATITLPLYEGRLASGGPQDGATLWYVVTDTSDEANAAALGLNFSAKLAFSDLPDAVAAEYMSTSVRAGYYDEAGVLVVSGGPVDFAPERMVMAGSSDTQGTSNLLASLTYQPGAIGADVGDPDGFYSPLVRISNANNHVYNAPIVSFGASRAELNAYCDGITDAQRAEALTMVHDSVVNICPGDGAQAGTVTIELATGFSFGRPVLYLSTDTSADIAAALEGAIFAPALANVPVGRDDSLFSAVERIFGVTNGPTNEFGEVNPQRQGFNSAIVGEGFPLNVLGGIPTVATDYSPLWDLNLGEWTQEAIDNGYRARVTEEFQVLGMVERGYMTGPGGAAYGSIGIIINCPIVHRLL